MNAALRAHPARRPLHALVASLGLHASVLTLGVLTAAKRDLNPVVFMPSKADSWAGSSTEVEAPSLAEPVVAANPIAAPAAEPAVQPEPAVAPPEAIRSDLPRKRRPRSTIPATAAASATPASIESTSASAESAAQPASSGTFGSSLPPGVRRLGYAFTRAIPAAATGDSAWRELPAGSAGTIRIELAVDAAGQLGRALRWKAHPAEPDAPAALERMVERTLILLRAGQFALSSSNGPGTERLTIQVQLSDGERDPDAGDTVVQKKFDGASPGHVGKAYFRYGTGRAFEASVTIAPAGSD